MTAPDAAWWPLPFEVQAGYRDEFKFAYLHIQWPDVRGSVMCRITKHAPDATFAFDDDVGDAERCYRIRYRQAGTPAYRLLGQKLFPNYDRTLEGGRLLDVISLRAFLLGCAEQGCAITPAEPEPVVPLGRRSSHIAKYLLNSETVDNVHYRVPT